jgi:hypothetical protein
VLKCIAKIPKIDFQIPNYLKSQFLRCSLGAAGFGVYSLFLGLLLYKVHLNKKLQSLLLLQFFWRKKSFLCWSTSCDVLDKFLIMSRPFSFYWAKLNRRLYLSPFSDNICTLYKAKMFRISKSIPWPQAQSKNQWTRSLPFGNLNKINSFRCIIFICTYLHTCIQSIFLTSFRKNCDCS